MTDKPKKFEEILKFAHNFNNNTVDRQWDQWKEDVASELDDHVETQDELNELMEYIRKENIGEICKDIFEGAAENLTNEKYENGEWKSN